MTVERVALADVPAMIADRRLLDAKTIIGLDPGRAEVTPATDAVASGGGRAVGSAGRRRPRRCRRCPSTSRSTSPGWPPSGAGRQNTLSAYRRDLRGYWAWLVEPRASPSTR